MIAALGFLRSPVGKYIGIALAVLAFVAYIRHDAASKATLVAQEECRQEVQARTEAEIARQLEVTETVLEEARKRQAVSEAELETMRERADELLREINESGASCPLDPDTVRRLRNIN